jgi:hypothetical protein
MKYLYSVLIIAIGFFALPLIFDLSGHVADHLRLSGKEGDDSTPSRFEKIDRYNENQATITTTAQPIAVKIIKE